MREIAVDPKLLGIEEWLKPLGNIVPVVGRNTDPDAIANADALAIRSVTKVNEALLTSAKPTFVGTTTVGFDHIDTALMDERGIAWTNAPGCNAPAVADYVESVLANHTLTHQLDIEDLVCGVIGVGTIGQIVAQRLSQLGARVLLHDPPRQEAGGLEDAVSMRRILADCDVVCVHVPLVTDGPHPTFHLLGEAELAKLTSKQLLISAGRGAAINNQALLERLQQANAPQVALDVWENEPHILADLWPLCDYATPHIAGHALEGKLRGTRMIARSLADHWGIPFRGPSVRAVAQGLLSKVGSLPSQSWQEKALAVYNVKEDDKRFRKALDGTTGADLAAAFDKLRDEYPKRREIH